MHNIVVPRKVPGVALQTMRLPRMHAHQFYDRDRLLALQALEEENFLKLSQMTDAEMPENPTLLEPAQEQEKQALLAEGFDWTNEQYRNFVRASARFGRDQLALARAGVDVWLQVLS